MISLFKAEAKVNTCEADLKRYRVLKHRIETLQVELAKTVQIHSALMTKTKTPYVQKVLSLRK